MDHPIGLHQLDHPEEERDHVGQLERETPFFRLRGRSNGTIGGPTLLRDSEVHWMTHVGAVDDLPIDGWEDRLLEVSGGETVQSPLSI